MAKDQFSLTESERIVAAKVIRDALVRARGNPLDREQLAEAVKVALGKEVPDDSWRGILPRVPVTKSGGKYTLKRKRGSKSPHPGVRAQRFNSLIDPDDADLDLQGKLRVTVQDGNSEGFTIRLTVSRILYFAKRGTLRLLGK